MFVCTRRCPRRRWHCVHSSLDYPFSSGSAFRLRLASYPLRFYLSPLPSFALPSHGPTLSSPLVSPRLPSPPLAPVSTQASTSSRLSWSAVQSAATHAYTDASLAAGPCVSQPVPTGTPRCTAVILILEPLRASRSLAGWCCSCRTPCRLPRCCQPSCCSSTIPSSRRWGAGRPRAGPLVRL